MTRLSDTNAEKILYVDLLIYLMIDPDNIYLKAGNGDDMFKNHIDFVDDCGLNRNQC